ncbi:MAG: YfhO family protein [Acidobacteriota bacterium]
MVLVLYLATALLVLGTTHRFVSRLSRGAMAFLLLLPFLFVGHALLLGRVYAPVDKIYMDIPLSQVKEQYGIGAPHNPATADIFSQMIPWRAAVREAYAHGEWPLWNPYILSGDILAAAAQPAPYSPFTLLALLLPAPLSFTFTAAMTFLLAALGAFVLARELGCREAAASIAAAGFAFSSANALYVLWPLGLSWALLPLVLLGAHRVVRAPSRSSWALLTTVLVLLVLAGHPETVLHVVAIGAIYGLVHLTRGNARRALAVAMAAGIVALLVCAIFLLPYLEAIPQTAEYAFRQTWTSAGFAQPLPKVLLVLAGDVFPALHLRRWVEPDLGGLHGESAAVGSIVLALAIYAAMRARSRATWFLGGLTLFCLLAHAGWGPLSHLLHSLPLFRITLNDRLCFAVACALSLLAAIGAEHLARRDDRRAVLLTLGLVLLLLTAGTFWIESAFVIESGPRDWGRYTAHAELAGLAGAFTLLLCSRRRGDVSSSMLVALLALILVQRVVSEGGVHASFPRKAAYPDMAIFAPMKNVREPFRMAGENWALLPGTNTLYGFEDVRGYEAMTFLPYVQTYKLWCVPQPVFFNRIDDLSKPFLSMMNVRFAFAYADTPVPPGWSVAAREKAAVLLENANVLPRAFVPRQVTVGMQDDVAVDQMATVTDFGERGWITANVVPFERMNGPGRATIRSVRGGYRITAAMDGEGWLIVSSNAWKGWRAYVDGKRIGFQRANVAFLGIHLEAGSHDVRLVYLPESFVLGKWISFATLLGVAAFGVWSLGSRRERTAF